MLYKWLQQNTAHEPDSAQICILLHQSRQYEPSGYQTVRHDADMSRRRLYLNTVLQNTQNFTTRLGVPLARSIEIYFNAAKVPKY